MTATVGPTDAELVARVLAADREAFAVVYDRYGTKLFDFAYSMLRHREDAADAVADSFVLFAERLGQLRDPNRLRPWLYAIVRSECLRRLKARKRIAHGDDDQLVAMPDDAITPDEEAERAALRQLVWDAAAGLADRDRALLDLHLRQGLEGAELGEAMGVEPAHAYVMLNRLRAQMDRSLGALLIARLGRDDCDELEAVLADWDGRFSPLIRKRVARHVENCDVCTKRRSKVVSPFMLLASVPMFAAPAGLRDRVLDDVDLVAFTSATEPSAAAAWRRLPVAGAAAATVLAVLGAVLLWPTGDTAPPARSEPVAGSTLSAPSTTPSPSPTSSPSVEQSRGTLALSRTSIDLGRTSRKSTVQVTNTGDLPVSYVVASGARWLSATPVDGRLSAGESAGVLIRADRSKVDEGRSAAPLEVTWDGGRGTVTVTLTEERPPVVGRPSAGSDPSCEVTVTATASDPSGLDTVTLRWTGRSGSGQAAMSRSGSRWSAQMGPFRSRATVTMTVVAKDTRGNTATGPPATVSVNPCPQ